MAWFSQIRRRLAVLVHRDRLDRELEEEMQSHLELQVQDNEASGMPAREAAAAARRQFGNAALLKETSRETWGWRWLEQLAQDLAYAFRTMRKNPGFATVAITVLALGSGANTAIFTVVNAILLRPLPFPNPQQLVYLAEINKQKGIEGGWISPGSYLDWRDRSHLLQDIGAFDSRQAVLTGAGEAVRLNGVAATASLLSTLGIRPVLGRLYSPEEDQPGRNGVALISENLWRSRFGGRSDMLGRSITIDSKPFTVVGIVACDVRLDEDAWDVWIPLALSPGDRQSHYGFYLFAIGRMKPGVTVEQARAEMRAIGEGVYRGDSELAGEEVTTEQLTDHLVRDIRPELLLLTASVGLLLLVACANVANLLLTRAAQRGREISVRVALGAGRWRIVRQLLTESLLLALFAGVAGLLLAYWSVGLLYGWMPQRMQTGAQPEVDLPVLGFTLAVSIGAGVLFGLAPAFRAARIDLAESLKETSRGIALGKGWLSGALVIAEAALAVVLLTGAGLLIRSFTRLLAVDPGFRPERLLTLKIPLSKEAFKNKARADFYEPLLTRVKAIPGVRSVAGVEYLPIEGSGPNIEYAVEGRPWHGSGAFVGTRIVTPDYFATMGIPLLQGRGLDVHDDSTKPEVAVINQTMAAGCWPGENAVGKRFRLNPMSGVYWIQVVGVVGDVKHFGLDGKKWPEAYFAERQRDWANLSLVVRTSADPLAMVPAIRAVVRSMDPNVPVAEVQSMESIVAESVAPRQLSMMLVTCFAGLALALASIGLYGVVSHSVARRRHELGIRMALGAARRDVLRLVLARGASLTLVGLAVGMAASLAATQLLSGMLFEVTFLDPLTYLAVAAVVLATALAAVYLPARAAAKIDPMEALRYE